MDNNSMIYEILTNKYNDCISTLRECSEDDDNNVYLCDSDEIAYDFDNIVKKFCIQYGINRIKSVDSLLIKDDKIYLIEFKNQINKNLKWNDIKLKVHESILILRKEFTIVKKEYPQIEVLVVYAPNKKEQKNLRDMRKHWRALTKLPDEVQQFDIFKKIYNINCLKFGNADFKKHVGV